MLIDEENEHKNGGNDDKELSRLFFDEHEAKDCHIYKHISRYPFNKIAPVRFSKFDGNGIDDKALIREIEVGEGLIEEPG